MNWLTDFSATLHVKIQLVPRSKHSVSVIKTTQLMLYREIIAKHKYTVWAERRICEC
jgi:hypothetical protein